MTRRYLPALCLLLVLIAPLPATAQGAQEAMQRHYQALLEGGGALLPGTALTVHSTQGEGEIGAEVAGLLPYPYGDVMALLAEPRRWCDILTLHFNVKACTHPPRQGEEGLTLYSGRKFYQTPQQAYPLHYRLAARRLDAAYASLWLQADEGPAGSRDYQLQIEAIPVAQGSFLVLRTSYRPSRLSTLLTEGYLATLGRGKVGFSRDGGGINGVIERNAMRYFLALRAHLEVQPLAPEARYEAALQRWFTLTEEYPEQLHEMEEGEYLAVKRRERLQQQRLQRELELAAS